MFATLLQSSYFALFLIVALGFILGRIQIKGLSLDVSAVIFIAPVSYTHLVRLSLNGGEYKNWKPTDF